MEYSIFDSAWPSYDPELAVSETVEMVVQVNGKVRARFDAPPDTPEAVLKQMALDQPRIAEILGEKETLKLVVVPGRLVSIVLR